MKQVIVNGRWPLVVPDVSADTPGWSWWERDRLDAMYAAIRPGDVVWEVGAERGYSAALYATWGAKVVLLEPEADWVSVLAVFSANGVAYIGAAGLAVGDGNDGGLRIDDVDQPKPDVISIDVEGAEYRVLLGATRTLTVVRPIVFVSIHPEVIRSDYNDTPDDVLCHLEKHHYSISYLGYDHERHYMAKPKP